jgi:hypothetical protein
MRIIKTKKKHKVLKPREKPLQEPSQTDRLMALVSGLFGKLQEQTDQNHNIVAKLQEALASGSGSEGETRTALRMMAETLKGINDKPIEITLPQKEERPASAWHVGNFERDYSGKLTSFKLTRIEGEN